LRFIDTVLKYKKIGIIGIAKSGLAVARKADSLGLKVFLSDNNPIDMFSFGSNTDQIDYKFKSSCEFSGHTKKLLENDVIIVSPGVPLDIPILQEAKKQNIPLWSEIEFAYRLTCPDSKIIAVTGSNGKSTVVSLIAHILRENDYKIILGGNIGEAYSSFDIENKYDFIILEISSFQLDLIELFSPDVAVVLNITPDHLNRYKSFKDYAKSKFSIFKNMQNNSKMIINSEDNTIQELVHELFPLKNFITFGDKTNNYFDDNKIFINNKCILEDINHLNIKGPHNMLNIISAVLCISDFLDINLISDKITSFQPLEHRLEFVKNINGIDFINDSKATNTDSVIRALQSFKKPIHLIIGGSDKGEDFSVLKKYLKYVVQLYLIGETAKKMQTIFHDTVEYDIYYSFESAVINAYSNAKMGEIILLAPACASFDWFKNFEHRGSEFKRIVQNIYYLGRKK
jgi:UDP-N-acetylmuramoylalanine--D-glutamate ligase